jgi:hypothetical protein
MEVVLPWSAAAEFMDMVMPDLSPECRSAGIAAVARTSVGQRRPLFMHPDEST